MTGCWLFILSFFLLKNYKFDKFVRKRNVKVVSVGVNDTITYPLTCFLMGVWYTFIYNDVTLKPGELLSITAANDGAFSW